jgi:hypothetical protein
MNAAFVVVYNRPPSEFRQRRAPRQKTGSSTDPPAVPH